MDPADFFIMGIFSGQAFLWGEFSDLGKTRKQGSHTYIPQFPELRRFAMFFGSFWFCS